MRLLGDGGGHGVAFVGRHIDKQAGRGGDSSTAVLRVAGLSAAVPRQSFSDALAMMALTDALGAAALHSASEALVRRRLGDAEWERVAAQVGGWLAGTNWPHIAARLACIMPSMAAADTCRHVPPLLHFGIPAGPSHLPAHRLRGAGHRSQRRAHRGTQVGESYWSCIAATARPTSSPLSCPLTCLLARPHCRSLQLTVPAPAALELLNSAARRAAGVPLRGKARSMSAPGGKMVWGAVRVLPLAELPPLLAWAASDPPLPAGMERKNGGVKAPLAEVTDRKARVPAAG